MLTVGEVQAWLNVSRSWVYVAAREGRLPAIRLGHGGPLRFREDEVAAYIEAGRLPRP